MRFPASVELLDLGAGSAFEFSPSASAAPLCAAAGQDLLGACGEEQPVLLGSYLVMLGRCNAVKLLPGHGSKPPTSSWHHETAQCPLCAPDSPLPTSQARGLSCLSSVACGRGVWTRQS